MCLGRVCLSLLRQVLGFPIHPPSLLLLLLPLVYPLLLLPLLILLSAGMPLLMVCHPLLPVLFPTFLPTPPFGLPKVLTVYQQDLLQCSGMPIIPPSNGCPYLLVKPVLEVEEVLVWILQQCLPVYSLCRCQDSQAHQHKARHSSSNSSNNNRLRHFLCQTLEERLRPCPILAHYLEPGPTVTTPTLCSLSILLWSQTVLSRAMVCADRPTSLRIRRSAVKVLIMLLPTLVLPLHSNNNHSSSSNHLLSLSPPHFLIHHRSLVRRNNGRLHLHLVRLFAVEWKNVSARLACGVVTQAVESDRPTMIRSQTLLVCR